MDATLRVLVVCSVTKGKINPFITEQVEALERLGISSTYYLINKKGIGGYLRLLPPLLKKIRKENFDLIHAHYGLSGLLAVLQRKLPVVITFHGSDVNQEKILRLSRWAAGRAKYNIIVEQSFRQKLGLTTKVATIPCGVSGETFFPVPQHTARKILGIPPEEKIVLFSSAFDNPVKNYPLAAEAIRRMTEVQLYELKGYDRAEVNLLMNAADALLLTSFSEGSPQVVKEALCCNLPVVSVPVGDVMNLLENVSGNHIVSPDPDDIARALEEILHLKERTNGHYKIHAWSNELVAGKISNIYRQII